MYCAICRVDSTIGSCIHMMEQLARQAGKGFLSGRDMMNAQHGGGFPFKESKTVVQSSKKLLLLRRAT
jgi:hypothetical protein